MRDDDFHRQKENERKNIEVWIDPFEWENKELMKEMRKKKTKPNYNIYPIMLL